ncbi:hypothetical protein Tco_0312099 [Tanacetum coccineum]
MTMEILLESTSNSSAVDAPVTRTASAAVKPCQGYYFDFYLITGSFPDDERRDKKKRLDHLKQDQTMLLIKRFSERKKVFRERKKTGKIRAKSIEFKQKSLANPFVEDVLGSDSLAIRANHLENYDVASNQGLRSL